MERFSIEWDSLERTVGAPLIGARPEAAMHTNLGAINWARTAAPTSYFVSYISK